MKITSRNFLSCMNEATRLTSTSSTCLDVIFSNAHKFVITASTFGCPFSDHNFVVSALNTKSSKSIAPSIESRKLTDDV